MHESTENRRPGHAGAAGARAMVIALIALVAAAVLSVPAATAASKPPTAQATAAAPGKAKAPKRPSGTLARQKRTGSPTARASSCSAPLAGDWRNINANTNAMTRALVSFACNDVVLCDLDGNCSGGDSYYSMQMFGKCHPTDCEWGRVRAQFMADGWIRGTYAFGFKTSHVWLKTYQYWGRTYLRVWVNNDFSATDGRADYVTDEWFLR